MVTEEPTKPFENAEKFLIKSMLCPGKFCLSRENIEFSLPYL